MKIIHIIEEKLWLDVKDQVTYFGDSLKTSGFIHCCMPEQVDRVFRKWFIDSEDIILLEINTDLLEAPLIIENGEGSEEKFPHIYGPLNMSAVNAWYPYSKKD